ncbi:MAG: hypothetical protein CME59_16095 [Halioglobus sp.]|nr:hypothetical protein [Halioglobus sp.]|tara:strand:+ start:12603 stop:13508 length:906 start_codon:yes stop_codon:yes gene_type:complete
MGAKSGYSDWQLWRIRDALAAYRYYEHAGNDDKFGWGDVHQAILEYTGFHIGLSLRSGKESIRKFVEGVPEKKKIGGRHWGDAEWVSYAVTFLTHPEIDYLSLDELEDESADYRFALFLARYIWEPVRLSSKNDNIPVGRYSAHEITKVDYIDRALYLEPWAQDKVFKATLIDIVYPEEVTSKLHELSEQERREKRQAYLITGGWGVQGPDNKITLWLKDEESCVTELSSISGLWNEDDNFYARVLMLSQSDAPADPVKRVSARTLRIRDSYLKLLKSKLITDFVLVNEEAPEVAPESAHG